MCGGEKRKISKHVAVKTALSQACFYTVLGHVNCPSLLNPAVLVNESENMNNRQSVNKSTIKTKRKYSYKRCALNYLFNETGQ